MNDFFINIYSRIKDENSFLTRLRFYSFLRFSLRLMSNIVIPIWFKFSFNKSSLDSVMHEKKNIIVSLTTFPARINRLWLVIECMLRQTIKPDRIVLWLSKDQFPDENNIPNNLIKLKKRGLEIILCDGDLKSHKKYYYAVKQYPNDIIITIDDDLFYASNTLEKLIDLNAKYPQSVCFNRGVKIVVKDGFIKQYKEWDYLYDSSGPAYNLLLTGCGGVLYPPNSLYKDVLNKDLFMSLCKNADDLWLYIMLLLNETTLVKTSGNVELIPIFNLGDITLSSKNVDLGMNDVQWNNIINYYKDSNQNIIISEKLGASKNFIEKNE